MEKTNEKHKFWTFTEEEVIYFKGLFTGLGIALVFVIGVLVGSW